MFDVLVIQTQKNIEYWESTFKSLQSQPITVHKIQGDGKSQLENFLIWPDICTSEFISFVDDDDLVPENAFEKCYNHLQQNPHIKSLYTNSLCVDYVKNQEKLLYQDHEWSIDHHLKMSFVPVHQLIIVQRKLVQYAISRLKQLDEYKKMVQYANEKILWYIIATQVPWYYFPEVCYIWRRHKNSISYTLTDQQKRTEVANKKLGRHIFKTERIY